MLGSSGSGSFSPVPRSEGGQPHIEVSPRNRPSEHSGENHPEFADDFARNSAHAEIQLLRR